MSRIFFTERPINLDNLKPFEPTNHVIQYPKEEIPFVHEFDRTALLSYLQVFQPDILVCGLKFQIDKEVLDSAPIKAVFTRTTGRDHIDLKYCEEKEIEIINLKGEELTDVKAVPLLSLWAILELVRKRGGQELEGKTLGIIGYGRIGKLLGDMAEKLGMKILQCDRHQMPSLQNALAYMVLQNSDIISLNISSTEENRGYFNRAWFEAMKDSSYFLNSSRGWLVDNLAFKEALESGKLKGAWSDFPTGFEHPNLIITEHIGGKTFESSNKTEKIICDKLFAYVQNNQSDQET